MATALRGTAMKMQRMATGSRGTAFSYLDKSKNGDSLARSDLFYAF
jgi:hypothetical protein